MVKVLFILLLTAEGASSIVGLGKAIQSGSAWSIAGQAACMTLSIIGLSCFAWLLSSHGTISSEAYSEVLLVKVILALVVLILVVLGIILTWNAPTY